MLDEWVLLCSLAWLRTYCVACVGLRPVAILSSQFPKWWDYMLSPVNNGPHPQHKP